jgi:ribosomal protein L11 methyltransferase
VGEPLTSVDWLEVRLSGPVELAARAELVLHSHSFPGWVDEEPASGFGFLLYLPQEPGWQERLASLREALPQARIDTGGQVRDEDWAENWKQFYHPLEVGNRLVICPSWEKFTPRSEQLVVILDPGSAFGTGYHWSTRLCLEFLEEVGPREPMLDLGTGSGILAIAAARLGVKDILAVDNDPVAVKVAKENVEINGCEIRVELAEAATPSGYALVTANLIAALLVEKARELHDCLAIGGQLICGGIIRERKSEVVEALQATGLVLEKAREREEWVSLLWKRGAE